MLSKVALVTGANKGIGYAIVRNLALQYAQRISTVPLTIFLTARNQNLGQESLKKIEQELKSRQILKDDSGKIELKFLRMDLTDEQSIKDVGEILERDYNGLDILINNAGIAFRGNVFDTNVVRTTLATNFYGTLNVCNHLYPLIRPNGRLVNISSGVGKLKILSSELQKEFSRDDLDINGLIGLMKKFEKDVEENRWKEEGWPTQSYAVSKVGVTALTKIFARRADSEGKNILVHACCPGWVATDMTVPNASRTPDQGAETPVYLSLDEEVVPKTKNGEFWIYNKVVSW
ncbi:11416_t:CDS:2 [Funneliformis geosporum]|uniref:13271_t:CDS:1 n=1 Tax=Funneliformis geosporum TaxID=1117311 RepID=A0A9W4SV41_9GLOM|nr:13271_t:CDS:2 [Funneliformis geosporum]CAI2182053.1 11416_t:CDS:2 [Funneliformis geosporum]